MENKDSIVEILQLQSEIIKSIAKSLQELLEVQEQTLKELNNN